MKHKESKMEKKKHEAKVGRMENKSMKHKMAESEGMKKAVKKKGMRGC